jgi:hypothetical protein
MAITPHFRNVVRSKSLTDLWGFQWHGFIRREVTRLGFLFPVAKNNRVMILLKSFFWSAVFHCEFVCVPNRIGRCALFCWADLSSFLSSLHLCTSETRYYPLLAMDTPPQLLLSGLLCSLHGPGRGGHFRERIRLTNEQESTNQSHQGESAPLHHLFLPAVSIRLWVADLDGALARGRVRSPASSHPSRAIRNERRQSVD